MLTTQVVQVVQGCADPTGKDKILHKTAPMPDTLCETEPPLFLTDQRNVPRTLIQVR